MAFSKANKYELNAQIRNHIMRACSHPARQKILEYLQINGKSTVKSLRKDHPISEPTTSEHLRLLRLAGLVEAEEKYPSTYYSLDKKGIQYAKEIVDQFFNLFIESDVIV